MTRPNAQADRLKKQLKSASADFPEPSRIRIHRAISWLGRAEAETDDALAADFVRKLSDTLSPLRRTNARHRPLRSWMLAIHTTFVVWAISGRVVQYWCTSIGNPRES